MKKIISLLLVILICSSSILPVFAANSNDYTQNSILVDYDGTEVYVHVFVADDATILVPADILTWFGGLDRKAEGSEYIYYQSNNEIGSYELSREIRISKNGSYGKSVMKVKQEKSLSGVSVNFKDSYTYDGDLFLPLEEIVPFLDAKTEITSDGILHIYPNPVSIFEALSYGDLSDMLDPDYDDDDYNVLFDISDGNGAAGLSMFVDTIMGRLDRLDFIFDSGTIKDYKKLYEKMLVQNDTYLAAFDKEETPYDTALTTIKKYLNEGNEYFDFVDGLLGKTEKILKYEVGSEKFKNYQEFSDDIDFFGVHAEVIDGVYKVVSYYDTLYKMVDDHHEVLYVVYENGDAKRTPAGIAANEVADVFGEDIGKKIKSLGVSSLRNFVADKIMDYLTKPIKPYLIVCNAIKDLIPGDLSDDYNQIYLDTIVADSREAFVGYYNNMSFNEESLNDLRLSLLMTMLASKYGYDISSMFDVTAYPDSIRSKNRTTVDNWLEKLYLAADSVECSTPEYYSKTKKELAKDIQKLKLVDNTNPDTPDPPINPDISTPSQGLEFTLNDDGKSYSVTGIGTCKDTNVVIPATYNNKPVTSIGDMAFTDCDSLTNITIPDSVTSIGIGVLMMCDSLTSIVVDKNNAIYQSIDGNLYSKNGKILVAYASGKNDTSFTIPNSVTSIGEGTFAGCTSLTNVTIPNSVTSIGESVFARCTSLTNITIPNSVTSIGGWAFQDCSSLTSITIPDNVTSIGEYAFSLCPSLTSITIPDSVTSIGYAAFWDCTALTSVYITDLAVWCNINFGGSDSNPLNFADNFYLNGNLITELVIPDNVTSIGDHAFDGYTPLTSVTIPDSVTSIGEWAFHNCTSLTSITIPDSVTSFGFAMFWNCTSLTSITFNGTVKQWNHNIDKSQDWDHATGYYTIYCTNGTLSKQR